MTPPEQKSRPDDEKKPNLKRLRMTSPDLTASNIEKLGELFPNVITETIDGYGNPVHVVDFDALRQELSDHVVEGPQERYMLDWPGKRAAAFAANAPIAKTLRPVREESVDFDTTKNIFIEGDNLDALKLLQESYLGKVKLIYIDPPYNTGSDFVYHDDFAETTVEYLERTGQMDEDGARLVANTDSNGRFHSDWLSMMYPRLKLARDLLTDDGAIFVNIDFNESHNLRRLMDEVFGSDNFQREIVWRIGWISGYKAAVNNFIRNHDKILFYTRNRSEFSFNKAFIENKNFKPLVKRSKELSDSLRAIGIDKQQEIELLDIINHENRPARYPLEDTWNCNEYDDLNSIAIVSFSGEKVSKLIGSDEFKGQKSIALLKRIINSVANDGDIILDFFAGTSSTAHAVLDLNDQDNGRRTFIMVQIPEEIDQASVGSTNFGNIAELSRERIRAVGGRYQNVDDAGFRTFKVSSTNLTDVFRSPGETDQLNLGQLQNSIKPDRSGIDILFQVLLNWGLELSLPITVEDVGGRDVFDVDSGALIACFDASVGLDVVRAIADRRPLRAVFCDAAFESDAARINVEQVFREVSPDTDVRVI